MSSLIDLRLDVESEAIDQKRTGKMLVVAQVRLVSCLRRLQSHPVVQYHRALASSAEPPVNIDYTVKHY